VEQSFSNCTHHRGFEQVETSAGGRCALATNAATPGNTVMLSLDIKLQSVEPCL
jgi:penicillin-binding protein 2